MLRFYTPPLCSGAQPAAVAAHLTSLRQDDGEIRGRELATLKRAIAAAEMRVEALAALITDPARAERDARELERLWTAAWDRLLDLRMDYSALVFNSNTADGYDAEN